MLIFNSRLHVVVSNQSIGPWLVNSIFYVNVLLAVGAAEYTHQHVLVVWLGRLHWPQNNGIAIFIFSYSCILHRSIHPSAPP